MKLIIKIIAITLLVTACNEKTETIGFALDEIHYKIISFTSQNSIDLNSDGVVSNDMLLETRGYNSLNLFDLRILIKKDLDLYNIFLPKQHIVSFSDFVDFSSFGYSIILDKGTNNVENYNLDNETKIILFEIISEVKCRLRLKKKYFDFNTNQFVNNEFEIIFEQIN